MSAKEDCFHVGAKAVIWSAKEKVLLLLQRDPNKFNGKEMWDIPGGRIHKNETLEAALKREVYEETGLTVFSKIKPLMMLLSPIRIPTQDSDVGLIFAAYLCETDTEFQVQLSEEHVSYGWFIPSQAAELLKDHYPKDLVEQVGALGINSEKIS